MSMTVYFFFSRFDPASLPKKTVGRFHQNAERTAALVFHKQAEAIYTGTFRTEGDSEVYIHICDSGQSLPGTLQIFRFKERILPEINSLYAAAGLMRKCTVRSLEVKISHELPEMMIDKCGDKEVISEGEEFDYTARAEMFRAETPRFTFDRVILPGKTRRQLDEAIAVIKYSSLVMDDWGLSDIVSPSVALNFYGPPGTGKTMAADAIADSLGLGIIRASCADIESKYHGESAKMVKAVFYAAEKQNAILFIDEADSLLSQRIGQTTQSADQALNATRSQLLLSLEEYKGIVIFATNFITSYDKAFISRLRCVSFPLPSPAERREIWRVHLFPTASSPHIKIPLADDVDPEALADDYELSGRDIREAVKAACFRTAMANGQTVTQTMLRSCCQDVLDRNSTLEDTLD